MSNTGDFNPPDVIEFWRPAANSSFMRIYSSFRIQRGDTISIQGSTYKVIFASYALDYSERVFERQMRLNVTVEPQVDTKARTRANRGSVISSKTDPSKTPG
jgi:hypothetical protein